MRILHVVTLVTPDGAYGGPTRVAVNLCSALREQGHDAVIAAGASGFDEPPAAVGGVPARLFPAKRVVPGFGYAATRAPALGPWIREHAVKFDLVHVHLARDLVTLPAVATLRRMRIPFVVQTHGMITPHSHPLAAPIDRMWTIGLLRAAAAVFHLNAAERHDLCAVGGSGLRLRQLRNGVAMPPVTGDRRPAGELPEVLFFARLHQRKRPEVFAEAALALLRSGVRARFAIVGPAEGAEAGVDAVVSQARAEGFGDELIRREAAVPPELAGERMAAASVYVLPAVREPFGMTVIEALMLGIPVVIGADAGLADFVETHDCGLVVDGRPQSFAQAISDLLSDESRARAMGRRGRSAVEAEYSIAGVGRELEQIYGQILEKGVG
ncbi:glycosyltransferase [Mycobacterium servetii]|uniref:Glycosyltransferase n=1 Tax=Mycobacterium servetii TaxID=3237418 RepID=A0ABV4BZ20_9MYCO